MKKLLIIAAGILSVICVAGFATLQLAPGTALSSLQHGAAWQAGFTNKTVELDGYTAHYLEAGPSDGPVVVLLHGLTDEKNSFVLASSELAQSHRVILPDLQAHGDNAMVETRDHSIAGQVRFVAQLLDALDVGRFVIGGNSMGGHVAAAFALTHQERVDRLIILAGTGMVLDEPPTYFTFPDAIDLNYVVAMYDRTFLEPPALPRPIMQHLASDLNARAPFLNRLVDEVVNGTDFRLDERIGELDIPVLIIWGREDEVVPIRYGEAYHAGFPNSEFVIVEAGHAPQLEIPDVVEARLSDFLVAD